MVTDSGAKMSDHLKQVEKTRKITIKKAHECPEELRYLWGWFCEIYAGEALTYTELKNWSELTCKRLSSWEAVLLVRVSK